MYAVLKVHSDRKNESGRYREVSFFMLMERAGRKRAAGSLYFENILKMAGKRVSPFLKTSL